MTFNPWLLLFFRSSNWVISTKKGGAAAALFDIAQRWYPTMALETAD